MPSGPEELGVNRMFSLILGGVFARMSLLGDRACA
jgi:hypothetical protein